MSNHNQDDLDFPGDDFQGDDFQDTSFDEADTYDADYTTGDDLADDEWDAIDDGSGEDTQQAPAKKKSSLTNKLIIGAAVVVGAGVMVMTMMGGAPQNTAQAPQPVAPSAAPADMAAMPADVSAPTPAPLPAPAPAPAPVADLPAYGADPADAQTPREPDQALPAQGIFNDPQALDSALQDAGQDADAMAPAPLSDARPVEVSDAPAMPDAPMAAAPLPTPAASAVAMPKANDLLKPSGAADVTPVVAEPTPAPVSDPVSEPASLPGAVVDAPLAAPAPDQSVSSSSVDAEMTAQMLDRLDLIAARLDQLEDDLSVVRKESAAAATDEVEELRAAVKALEKKLSTQAQAPASPTIETPAARTTTLKAEPKSKPAVRQAQPVQWVLKGAQPGRAMVSRAGESEMRTVEVGDSLPGVGRISSIAYENGRWVVIGSEGRISQ